MENNDKKRVTNLVVDSGAFIFRAPIKDWAENVYTLPDVVNEIRDEKTRESLQVLPYEIKYREPTEDDLKFVAEFAKKTGDYSVLSVTDMRLLALVVRLEREINKGANLREAPKSVQLQPQAPTVSVKDATIRDMNFFGYNVKEKLQKLKENNEINLKELDELYEEACETDDDDHVDESNNNNNNGDNHAEEQDENNQQEDEDDPNENVKDDDVCEIEIGEDEGWITKDNCQAIREKLLGIKINDEDEQELSVGCVTGDYAMQNVLLQMGLNVISPKDGLHIRQTRQFVQRCFSCFKINPSTASQFCKFCGNKTLKRVSVTINQDGTTKVHINFRRPINIRGMKHSLPMPRGGKHSTDPLLADDMRTPQQRKSKMAVQEKKQLNINSILNDPDYLVRSNPFSVNDVYSRGSRINTHQRKVVNPNETRKPTGNRKKKKSKY